MSQHYSLHELEQTKFCLRVKSNTEPALEHRTFWFEI